MVLVALTGATGGLGRAIARRFAREGAGVVALDLPAAAGAAEELGAHFIPLDVTDARAVAGAFDRCVREIGVPSVLVNNAGVAVRVPAIDLTADDWTRVLTTNLSGAFFCAQAFARAVIAAKMEGCIVNVASIFGLTGGPNRAAYSASKAGLVNLTRVLAYEWQPFGIRVNAVAPTFVRTPLTDRLLAGGLDIQNRALGERLATPEDVAEAVYFLSSHAAAMIAGHTLPVDGGWLAW